MPHVGQPWRKHFCDARFIVMEVDTSLMIILVMSWNTSTTAQVWLSWFCHKIVMDVHAWQKTRPTVTNTYHHGSVFFCSASRWWWWSWQCLGDGDQRHKMMMAVSNHLYWLHVMFILYASYFALIDGSIIRWSLTKFQGTSVLPEYAPLRKFVVPRHHVMIGCDKLNVHLQWV